MGLYRRMALALLAVGLVACGEGEGERDTVATDTSNNIGSYGQTVPEVMSAFKATGAGWQTRIDGALKDWLKTNPLG